ncbi:unnamed protein product, partial [Amoebophrya sp. A120]
GPPRREFVSGRPFPEPLPVAEFRRGRLVAVHLHELAGGHGGALRGLPDHFRARQVTPAAAAASEGPGPAPAPSSASGLRAVA